MDMGSITAVVGSLKAAGDIVKGLVSLKTTTEVQAKAIELNQIIIDAQHQIFAAHGAQTTLLDRVRELETQITRMNDWATQKLRFKLAAPFTGCMVYALQESMSDGEAPHYLCTACFQKGLPSILQVKQGKDGNGFQSLYYCPICKSEASTGYFKVGPPEYFENIQPQ